MDDPYISTEASNDFNRARFREIMSKIINSLSPERGQLLSLQEVKDLIKPKRETYKGMATVPIEAIIGSEGRYQDFNQSFLPKHEHIRTRWERVDKAHLNNIDLPPVKLYKMGDVYFVRDGNHRVSVAKIQGAQMIDAEIIELSTEIKIEPWMTHKDLRNKVIEYERDRAYRKTELGKVIPKEELVFTETGRYLEVLKHINVHKYFLNENKKDEIPFIEGGKSWYENLYKPIVDAIEYNNILFKFPGRTKSDLYVWIIKHWGYLKKEKGSNVSIEHAVLDFAKRFGKGFIQQIKDIFHRIFRK